MLTSPASDAPAGAGLTPAGLQSLAMLRRRRMLMAALNLGTFAALAALMAHVAGSGGWTAVDVAMMACFVFAAPWSVLGFWNALVGLWLLHGARGRIGEAVPFAGSLDGVPESPLRIRTAVLLTLRNEDARRAMARLRVMKDSVDATGQGSHFDWFVLSDSDRPEAAAAEEAAFAEWRAGDASPQRLHYRRRELNTGYKAGNLRDFCDRWGRDFEVMLPLDADSLMDGPTIVRMAGLMQEHPRLGILQSLVVGMPSASGFARLFQFGMRQGMRSYTMGSAWWAGDCGPFWGHNGMVRIAPFVAHCDLPILPGGPPLGGHIMSHDQLEAALMRRGGYEVRVLPVESGSFEENPPTVLEFTRRDLRWCQGNMQYWRLLGTPGLLPMSRFQLVWAILMFLGIPAWTALIALAAVKPFETQDLAGGFPAWAAIAVYGSILVMFLAPKIAGVLDVLLTPGGTRRYGGTGLFLAGFAAELVFSFLLGAVTTLRMTLFMIGLAFGKAVGWNGQARDAHALSWSTAVRGLWPQTLFGLVVIGAMAWKAPAVLAWAAPLVAGFPLAIPFAVLTAHPAFGRALARRRLAATPEEIDPPPEFRALEARPPAREAAVVEAA